MYLTKKAALLVVDMQNEFFNNSETQKSLNSALEYINYTIGNFRKAGQPVIFVADEEAGEGIGSEGYQLYKDLNFESGDTLISKKFCNSFWETELESKLKALDVSLVVVCGFAAEYCIYNTYHGAIERGFETVLLQHGIASADNDHLKMIEDICDTSSYSVLEYFL